MQQHQQQQTSTRVVSHWVKSTPEEGIQLIFNKAEADKGPAGVHIVTSPPSNERPCQWDISLRPASTSSYLGPVSVPKMATNTTIQTPSPVLSSHRQATNSVSCHQSATSLLVLTLQRASIRLGSMEHSGITVGGGGGDGGVGGSNVVFEDPMNPSRQRCDSYRTMYIYSPRLRRDIHVQPINRDLWPQIVVFKCEDVVEDDHKYHLQIWLSGSSPRQTDAETELRISQQRNLLFAMRQDTATCNVQINIKDQLLSPTVEQVSLETTSGFDKQIGNKKGSLDQNHSVCYLQPNISPSVEPSNSSSNSTHERCNIKPAYMPKCCDNKSDIVPTEITRATFWAHKIVLESIPFFSRMLSYGRFKEGLPGPDGIYRINLSSDMFEPRIMDTLLDYIYTREPIQDGDESLAGDYDSINKIDNNAHHHQRDYMNSNHKEGIDSHSDQVKKEDSDQHRSANVGLNLETVITKSLMPRTHHSQYYTYSSLTMAGSNTPWPFAISNIADFNVPSPATVTTANPLPPPTSQTIIPYINRYNNLLRNRLKSEDWFLLYRAAIHMEDYTLQAQALDKIQAQLNVQSALERALKWGPGYPEIKRVVLKYVFDERRAIFGNEKKNQLRPYLWPEIEDQVDVLVEITSKIARQ
ncbi:hypothetical protein FBU30_010257 [Linnemannia zychae]|nr:hypothetical protein FBU30_010257 [Linnemannia zychae]